MWRTHIFHTTHLSSMYRHITWDFPTKHFKLNSTAIISLRFIWKILSNSDQFPPVYLPFSQATHPISDASLYITWVTSAGTIGFTKNCMFFFFMIFICEILLHKTHNYLLGFLNQIFHLPLDFYNTVVHKGLLEMRLKFLLLLGRAYLFLQKTYLQFHWQY